MDLEKEVERMREEMEETGSELKLKKLSKRVKLMESFIGSKNKPEWMVLTMCR
jgi:DNA-directed RNA polymerase subunit beta'